MIKIFIDTCKYKLQKGRARHIKFLADCITNDSVNQWILRSDAASIRDDIKAGLTKNRKCLVAMQENSEKLKITLEGKAKLAKCINDAQTAITKALEVLRAPAIFRQNLNSLPPLARTSNPLGTHKGAATYRA